MAWNNPFTRAALHRMANDPKVRQMFGKVTNTVRSHPATHKFASQMRSRFASFFERSAKPAGATSGAGATGGAASGPSTGMFASARRYWEQHRERVLAFVAANFMGILFFLQFGSQLWHMFLALLRSLLVEDDKHKDPRRIDDQQRKKKKKESQQPSQQQSGDVPRRLAVASSSAASDGNDVFTDAFAESFQFKIGETTEFTGSLSSMAVTGTPLDSSNDDRHSDGDGALYFDLRSPQPTLRGPSSHIATR